MSTETNQEILERGRNWSILMSKTLEDYTQSRQDRIEKERIAARERAVNEHTEYCWQLIETRIKEIMIEYSKSESDISRARIMLVMYHNQHDVMLDDDVVHETLNNVIMRMGLDCVNDEKVGEVITSYLNFIHEYGYAVTWNQLQNMLAIASDRSRLDEFYSKNDEDE